MALGDLMAASRFSQSTAVVSLPSNDFDGFPIGIHHAVDDGERSVYSLDTLSISNDNNVDRDLSETESSGYAITTTTSMAYLPQTVVLCERRHDGFEDSLHLGPSDSGLVSKWRLKDRMNTAVVALVLCLNISVDPPDVIKISPCARMECWIDPFSMEPREALETIGRSLTQQYERWQPQARYKCSLDPTVDEVKKLCTAYRKYAKSERVLFHYNGHGVPKPTPNGEIWMFNKSHTQYIPLPISDLDSCLKTPSLYVFDCSAAGLIINAFIELQDSSVSSSGFPVRDLILLAACEAHEVLPQSVEFPADVFTSCLTTPIKMALRWLCTRSLLHDSIDYSLIDKIPGRQTDRKTLLGELNWIFTAVTDAIAWNVLPPDLFQKLFRQDLLVASLFRNFLLAERIMRSANCTPVSHPLLPSTHQHHMWDAWDMAAEICLSQLPALIEDPNAGFQPSPFFTDQLAAFEVWLDHGSEHKKPPEQLPIVLQVLLSQCHRFRALVLIGRFLDMGPWAVDLALSVGIFQYVLKLLPTATPEVQQILVFIWTKILVLDKSCQIDLVKYGGHTYLIRFLDSAETYPEQRAMAAFVLAVIVDGHRRGQEACIKAGLVHVCLKLLQGSSPKDTQNDHFFLQWICLCLGKTWEDFPEAQMIALQADATSIIVPLLSEPQPEVRASAVFALGTMLHLASHTPREDHGGEVGGDDDKKFSAEGTIIRELLNVVSDGSPLVRAEVAVALSHFAFRHNRQLKAVAASYWKLQGSSVVTFLPSCASKGSGYSTPNHCVPCGIIVTSTDPPLLRAGNDGQVIAREGRISTSSPLANTGIMHGSPLSDDSSQHLDAEAPGDLLNDGIFNHSTQRHLDNELSLQFVLAMCNLAKDPSPRVASLGRQVLGIIGIEQVVARSVKPCPRAGDSTIMGSTSLAGIAHSSSWFDMSGGGHLPLTFRTPPVSPPRPSYMTGVRRICSLEFRPPLINSPDSGLADPLLSSVGTPGTSSLLPQQMIYSWSCGHFSKPLLTAADDSENIVARREERKKQALDLIVKCQHASVSKLHNQIASWDTKFETGTKSALFQPFSPVVVASDENDKIRVWNYEEAALLNSFDNNEVPENRGVSKLCVVNDLDENLLLVASNNGNIRIWKDYTSQGQQKLVTAFASIQGHKPGIRSVNTVVDWQQQSGYLFTSGEISSVMAWDLGKEQLLGTIPLASDSSISALTASQVHGGQFAAGFVDGYVRLYDIRSPQMLVSATQPHTHRMERVVDVGFQPGLEPAKIISASQGGNIQFLDMRYARESYLTIEAHRGSLTALAVHRHAPLIASGSAKQLIKVFNLEGVPLGTIRYYPTLMAQRIGPVSCLTFHPYQVLLAAGAADACVSIYADDNSASSR